MIYMDEAEKRELRWLADCWKVSESETLRRSLKEAAAAERAKRGEEQP